MTASSKMLSYLGFARKSGNLMRGYNTCLSLVESGKVRLLIVAEDGEEAIPAEMCSIGDCIQNIWKQ